MNENVKDLIQSVNAEGKFIYVNRSWLQTLGYSKDEVKDLKKIVTLNTEKEIGVIQKAIDPARGKGWLEIDYLETVTLTNLRSKIKHFQPHILHYTGHGGKLPFSNETYLACEDDDGELKYDG